MQNLFGGGGGTGSNRSSSPAGGSSSSSDPAFTLASLSNLVVDSLNPNSSRRRDSITNNNYNNSSNSNGPPTAEENARRFNYNDREAALAETLEIAQDRIMELVAEMESTQEAQTIVLETKESVLRSLARQNTHLAMEVSGCSREWSGV